MVDTATIRVRLINEGTPVTRPLGLRSEVSAKSREAEEVKQVSKLVAAGLLALFGLGLIGDYPVVGFGVLGVAGLLVWMSLQSRQSVRVDRSRPVAARSARMEVAQEVNAAQRAANREMRQAVSAARREAQRNLASAVERVRAEQAARWVA